MMEITTRKQGDNMSSKYKKKYMLPIKRHEVILTGIGEKRVSKYGGTYRYIFALGPDANQLDPASLSSQMQNKSNWDLIVKLLEDRKKLFCDDAVIVTRKGKRMIDCDFVPTVIEMGDELDLEAIK